MSSEKKVYPFPTNEKIDMDFQVASPNKDNSGNGGGGDMTKYVTREELRMEMKLLESKMDNKFLQVDNKFNELKLDLKNQQSLNIRWMIGTAIALAGVIIAAIKLL